MPLNRLGLAAGVADDGRRCPAGTVNAAIAGSGHTLYELHFANWAQFFGTVHAIHGIRFNEGSGANVMSTVDVGVQLVKQIRLVGNAPCP